MRVHSHHPTCAAPTRTAGSRSSQTDSPEPRDEGFLTRATSATQDAAGWIGITAGVSAVACVALNKVGLTPAAGAIGQHIPSLAAVAGGATVLSLAARGLAAVTGQKTPNLAPKNCLDAAKLSGAAGATSLAVADLLFSAGRDAAAVAGALLGLAGIILSSTLLVAHAAGADKLIPAEPPPPAPYHRDDGGCGWHDGGF